MNKKNPIFEISCQISFPDDVRDTLSSDYFFDFRNKVGEDFPNYQTEQQYDLSVNLGEDDNTIHHALNQRDIHKFFSTDKDKTILLCENFLVFSLNFQKEQNYKKWESDFYPTLEKLYNDLTQIIPFKKIKSIGVRYIDKIDPIDFDLSWEELFNHDNEYLPRKVLFPDKNNEHLSRLQFNQAMNQKLVIQTAYQQGMRELILDIDAISENIALNDFKKSVNDTQKRVEDSFFDIISDKFKHKILGA